MRETTVSRRTFLKGSAATAALACAAGSISLGSWQAERAAAAEPAVTATAPSLCNGCSSKCGLIATTVDGQLWTLKGNEVHPYSKGRICGRGHGLAQMAYSDERVTQPLRRKDDGTFEPIDWDTAFKEIGAKVQDIIAKYGYYWGSWAEYLGRMHPSRTSFYVPMAFLLTAALFLIISLSAEYESAPPLLLMLPLPVLSLVCLRRCHAEVPDGRYARTVGSKRYLTALASLVTLIVASLVLSLLFGLVWEMTVLSVGSVNEAHQAPLVANLVVAVCLIGLVLYAHKRLDLALAYRVIVPVIVILFAVLPFFWETSPVVLNAVMSACYGTFDVIIWYMVVSASYDFAVSGFVIGALVRRLSILARLLGIGIGYLLMLVPGSPSLLIVGISVGAVYVLAMLGLFYRTRRKGMPIVVEDEPIEKKAAAPATNAPPAEPANAPAAVIAPVVQAAEAPAASIAPAAPETRPDDAPLSEEAVFEQIAEDFSLTRREAELLPFIARGRSARVIADALFVSENTIRTHTRRILEKTDLHSKQQVIDLIEKYR